MRRYLIPILVILPLALGLVLIGCDQEVSRTPVPTPTPAPVKPAPAPDRTPPVISEVSVSSITKTSATITWRTNKPTDSRVVYQETDNTYSIPTPLEVKDSNLTTNHSVTLTNLIPGATYNFGVSSGDATHGIPDSKVAGNFITQKPEVVLNYRDWIDKDGYHIEATVKNTEGFSIDATIEVKIYDSGGVRVYTDEFSNKDIDPGETWKLSLLPTTATGASRCTVLLNKVRGSAVPSPIIGGDVIVVGEFPRKGPGFYSSPEVVVENLSNRVINYFSLEVKCYYPDGSLQCTYFPVASGKLDPYEKLKIRFGAFQVGTDASYSVFVVDYSK